ncbi:MAG: hypothetical protein FJY91_03145 [Candidatus Harrisonbacteria bacterium]|nr:hypothetical protein [Candidatus Harrisonbacteria bacterium]
MPESFENKNRETLPEEKTAERFINEQQKAEIRAGVLDIANVEKYKIKDKDEENWLANIHEELKKSDLFSKYASERTPAGYGISSLRTDKIGSILNEVQDRIFVSLYEGDLATAEKVIAQAHSLFNGVRKINEHQEHTGGCVCDECADLGRLASVMGFSNLSSRIRTGTMCPEFSTQYPTTLEDYFRHDKKDFSSPEEFSKEVDDKLVWYAGLPQAKGRLHEVYKEFKNKERQEKIKNPRVSEYLKIVEEYNKALNESYRSYYFDGSASNARVFPGERIELPEGELKEGSVIEYLKDADNKFFEFDTGIFTDIPLGRDLYKGEGPRVAHMPMSVDFIRSLGDAKKQIVEAAKKEYGDLLKSQNNNQYEHQWIEEESRRSSHFALIASVFERAGDKEKAQEALRLAKEASENIGNKDYYMAQRAGERYSTIALAELASGGDPSEMLQQAEARYMNYIGGFESHSGIGPTTRMHGLHDVAKMRVLAGQDPLPTLSKLDTISDKISGVTKASVDGFAMWSKIRTTIKTFEEGSKEKKDK